MTARMRDVAQRAGVSVKTVSNVINDYPHVTPTTRARVEAAITELDYRPNLGARSLRLGRCGVIALVIPDLAHPYFAGLAAAVARSAKIHGVAVLIEQTDGDNDAEALALDGLRDRLVDGLLLWPSATVGPVADPRRPADPRKPAGLRRPVVLLGDGRPDLPFDRVSIDKAPISVADANRVASANSTPSPGDASNDQAVFAQHTPPSVGVPREPTVLPHGTPPDGASRGHEVLAHRTASSPGAFCGQEVLADCALVPGGVTCGLAVFADMAVGVLLDRVAEVGPAGRRRVMIGGGPAGSGGGFVPVVEQTRIRK